MFTVNYPFRFTDSLIPYRGSTSRNKLINRFFVTNNFLLIVQQNSRSEYLNPMREGLEGLRRRSCRLALSLRCTEPVVPEPAEWVEVPKQPSEGTRPETIILNYENP